jgi:hypothetical protein
MARVLEILRGEIPMSIPVAEIPYLEVEGTTATAGPESA